MSETFEEQWEELIGGQAVQFNRCPSISHNTVAENICCLFGAYLRGREGIRPFRHMDFRLTEKDHFTPDFAFICGLEKLKRNYVDGAPDFAAEVLSPGTARRDKGYKKGVYERCGVREYWIVDPQGRSVEQYVLENGAFTLREVYYHYRAYELEDMTEAEKAEIVTEIRPALFEDLSIPLEDLFYYVSD
jgi:Uma2 family endonuclease